LHPELKAKIARHVERNSEAVDWFLKIIADG
jgi:hypothetical protein